MVKILNKLIMRYGAWISAFAVMVAALSSDLCRGEWYQPVEPEGLEELMSSLKGYYMRRQK